MILVDIVVYADQISNIHGSLITDWVGRPGYDAPPSKGGRRGLMIKSMYMSAIEHSCYYHCTALVAIGSSDSTNRDLLSIL